MTVYIQQTIRDSKESEAIAQLFEDWGHTVHFVERKGDDYLVHNQSLFDLLTDGDLVHGSLELVRKSVQHLGGQMPPVQHYPDQLKPWLGREIQQVYKHDLVGLPYPYFVKEVGEEKASSTRVVRDSSDFLWIPPNVPLWLSEHVTFVSEYRAFVLEGEVLDVSRYRGEQLRSECYKQLLSSAEEMAAAWGCSGGLDIGMLDDGD